MAANARVFHASLPQHLRDLVDQLASEVWRERKQATFELTTEIEALSGDTALIELCMNALMDEVISPATIGSRAAAQEVIAQVGAPFAHVIVHRVRTEPASAARMLVDVLAQIGTAQHVEGLIDILRDPERDENLRASVATVLGAIGGDAAVRALIDALDSPSSAVRLFSLDALRTTDVALRAEELTVHFADPSLRKAVAALLGRIPSLTGAKMLVTCLGDKVRSLRATAIVALAEIVTHSECPAEIPAFLEGLFAENSAYVSGLHGLLEHADTQVCAAAVLVAATIGDRAVLPALLARMDEQPIYERALALVERLGARAIASLIDLLNTEHDSSRLEATLRLSAALDASIADAALVAAVEQHLDSLHDEVVIAACDALAGIGDARSVPHLLRRLDHDDSAAEHAADALGTVLVRVFGERALAMLEPHLAPANAPNGQNMWNTEASQGPRLVCRLIGRLGDPKGSTWLETFLQSPQQSVRVAAVQALGQISGDEGGVLALCMALTDESVQVRAMACRSLGRRAVQEGVDGLCSAVNDPDASVQAAAIQALAAISAKDHADVFRSVVAQNPPNVVLIPALAGLAESGDDADLPVILNLCAVADSEIVKAAARALVLQKSRRATVGLISLLGHAMWDVRWVAAQGLLERADPSSHEALVRALESENDPSVNEALVRAIEALKARRKGVA
jgi:HEAT repeat protein